MNFAGIANTESGNRGALAMKIHQYHARCRRFQSLINREAEINAGSCVPRLAKKKSSKYMLKKIWKLLE